MDGLLSSGEEVRQQTSIGRGQNTKKVSAPFFSSCSSLVPRVLRLFDQRLVDRRDSREFKKIIIIIFLIGCSVAACVVLLEKSCGNKISVGGQPLAKEPVRD